MSSVAQLEQAPSRVARKGKAIERFIVMEFNVQVDAPVNMRYGPLATLLYRSTRIARLIGEAVEPELPRICNVTVQEIEK
jgi:hypothetical protein